MQLILLKDWQRALIRATLFPNEIETACVVKLYGISWKLLPLHLACALKPPTKVIAILTQNGLASVPVQKRRRKRRRRFRLSGGSRRRSRSRFSSSSSSSKSSLAYDEHKELLSRREGSSTNNSGSIVSFPAAEDDSSYASMTTTGTNNIEGDDHLWSNNQHKGYHHGGPIHSNRYSRGGGGASSLVSLEQSIGDIRSYATSSLGATRTIDDGTNGGRTSLGNFLEESGIVLQLTESGGVAPIPVTATTAPKKFIDPNKSSLSIPHNDTQSLTVDGDEVAGGEDSSLEIVSDDVLTAAADNHSLLPIHIACLYQASPSVLQVLIQEHPMGALSAIVGMLPIHLVAAGWKVEPIEVSHGFARPSAFDEFVNLMNSNNSRDEGIAVNDCHHSVNSRMPSLGWNTSQALRVMQQQFPELLFAKSANHGMSPLEYVEEMMDDGPNKDECLEWMKDCQLHCENNELCRPSA